MIILAIVATICAVIWSMLVGGANAMSDNVTIGFEGAGSLAVAWLIVAVFWLAWAFS